MRIPRDRAFERRVSRRLKASLREGGVGWFQLLRIRFGNATRMRLDIGYIFVPIIVLMVFSVVEVTSPGAALLVVWPLFALAHALWWAGGLSLETEIQPGDLVLCHYPVSSEEYWWMVVPGAVLRFFAAQSVFALLALIFGLTWVSESPERWLAIFFLSAAAQASALFAVAMWLCFRSPGAPYRRTALALLVVVSAAFYFLSHVRGGCAAWVGWALSPFVFGFNQWVAHAGFGLAAGVWMTVAALVAAVAAAIMVYRGERWWYEVYFPPYYDVQSEEPGDIFGVPGTVGDADDGEAWDAPSPSASKAFDSMDESIGLELRGFRPEDGGDGMLGRLARRVLGERGEVVLDFLSSGRYRNGEMFTVSWKWRIAMAFLVAIGISIDYQGLVFLGESALVFSMAFVFNHGLPGLRPAPLGNVSIPLLAFYPVTMREIAWIHLKTTLIKFAAWIPYACLMLALGLRYAYDDLTKVALLTALAISIFGAALPLLTSFELFSVTFGHRSLLRGFAYGFFLVSVIVVDLGLLSSVFFVDNWTWRWIVPLLIGAVSAVYFAVSARFLWGKTMGDFVHPIRPS